MPLDPFEPLVPLVPVPVTVDEHAATPPASMNERTTAWMEEMGLMPTLQLSQASRVDKSAVQVTGLGDQGSAIVSPASPYCSLRTSAALPATVDALPSS